MGGAIGGVPPHASAIDPEPTGGTYIYLAWAAYDEEHRFDHERLNHWLNRFDLNTVGGVPGAENGPFHASGHIDGPSMEWLIESIKPEKILRGQYGQAVRFD